MFAAALFVQSESQFKAEKSRYSKIKVWDMPMRQSKVDDE